MYSYIITVCIVYDMKEVLGKSSEHDLKPLCELFLGKRDMENSVKYCTLGELLLQERKKRRFESFFSVGHTPGIDVNSRRAQQNLAISGKVLRKLKAPLHPQSPYHSYQAI